MADPVMTASAASGLSEYLERRTARVEALRCELEALCAVHGCELTLEVGCGHGHFLTAYAQAMPVRFCIGIDLRSHRIRLANAKAKKRGLAQLCFLKAEASEFMEALPPQIVLERIFVLFPDPWPKKRHIKNRMLQPAFVAGLAQRAAPGAHLYFRTDVPANFEWSAAQIEACPGWRIDAQAPWPLETESYFQGLARSWQSLIAVRR